MILSALNDYYTRSLDDSESGISRPGYSMEKISYAIVLDVTGNIVAVDDIRELSGKKLFARGLVVPASFKRSGDVYKPFFTWDKTSYVLGVSKLGQLAIKNVIEGKELSKEEAKKLTRLPKEFMAFKGLHIKVLAASSDAGAIALLAFLDAWTPEVFSSNPFFKAHGDAILDTNIVFRLDGEMGYLHDRKAFREVNNLLADSDEILEHGMCLVTGEFSQLARIHESIKGVKNGQSSGGSIVSFNKESFNSYGKHQGGNAPISKNVADAYVIALNHLLSSARQRLQIGDATVVFWAQAESNNQVSAAENIFSAFFDPKDDDIRETEKLRNALEHVRQGKPLPELSPDLKEDTKIFVLGLAPNASRLSIRYWETGTLQMFAERLALHYEDLHLEPSPWRTPPAMWRLLLSAAPNRDGKAKSEDVPPQLAGELARAVLTGGHYPYSLLGTLVMRMRADGDEKAFGARASLIKAVLSRAKRLGKKINYEGELPVSLDTSNTDPGYLLGRLFASLENIQRLALGKNINATIRDRYYGAASATPANVFPMLLRNTQNHLSKIRKEKAGLAVNLEKEIGEIIDLLKTEFPRNLKLEAQGHFAIGYYHQKNSRFVNNDASEEDNQNEGENK